MIPIVVIFVALLGWSDRPAGQTSLADVACAIRAHINDSDLLLGASTRAEQAELTALYGQGAYAPLWTDASGRPTRDVRDALMPRASIGGKREPRPTHAQVRDSPSPFQLRGVQSQARQLGSKMTREACGVGEGVAPLRQYRLTIPAHSKFAVGLEDHQLTVEPFDRFRPECDSHIGHGMSPQQLRGQALPVVLSSVRHPFGAGSRVFPLLRATLRTRPRCIPLGCVARRLHNARYARSRRLAMRAPRRP